MLRGMNQDSPPALVPLLLVDANTDLRVGLAAWLRQEFPECTVATAADLARAEQLVAMAPPAIALVNVDERQGAGFATLRRLGETAPDTLCVALSVYPVEYFELAAAAAGAQACACIVLTDNRLRDLLRRLLPRLMRRA